MTRQNNLDYDVIIVGAGPAGLQSARECELKGLTALVLEEHKQIGRPNHCSGLISANLDSFIPEKELESCIEHRVRGAIMYSPNGKQLKLEKPDTAAYVIDRASFDQILASKVKSEIKTKSGVDAFTVLDDRVVVKSGGQTFEASALLGCDGSNSFIRRQMQVSPKETMNGLIALTAGNINENTSEFVEMWFDKQVCDGFLWKIPRGDRLEYGMLGTNAKFNHLIDFFDLKGERSKFIRQAGIISLGPPKTYFDRVLLVGDAAAQVKPWSGGGVIYSLKAAGIAVNVLKQAKDKNDFSENNLKTYEDEWKAAFGKQIRTGMLGRSVFKRMGNTRLNLAMRTMNKASFLMNKLDMDFLVKK